MTLKKTVKKFLPPVLLELLHRGKNISFAGDYNCWETALTDSAGYDADSIFKKVCQATSEVIAGNAAYERDGVLFYEKEYNWPLISTLLLAAVKNNDELNVLDFGGALGSSYFQNRDLLCDKKLTWNIVEQKHFVKYGKEKLENNILKFYDSVEDCLKDQKINVALLACVLPYLNSPWKTFGKILNTDFDYVIIERALLVNSNQDRLTIQTIPDCIYKASYPAWFLSRKKFLMAALEKYQLIAEFECKPKEFKLSSPKSIANNIGFILKKK
ncbi:MAG: methyltransferase, TIGR04325 family [Lentisphaerae bacterium]|nr:methyltransferase, TIGR04325 family [Lentisphaerota bacterium]MCP4100701.1 methyltransferase, TIGR04325 family [Lentisphaerota bacterium]